MWERNKWIVKAAFLICLFVFIFAIFSSYVLIPTINKSPPDFLGIIKVFGGLGFIALIMLFAIFKCFDVD